MKFVALIPARYASTRFPGKPLARIDGKYMIERVYERVKMCLDGVWVATDDARIYEAVQSFGGQVVMTSTEHRSGTDRCLEAAHALSETFDVVINVQGDEPFVEPSQIESLKSCFTDNPDTQIATLVKPFTQADGWEALSNPNSPKVVLDQQGRALYFSRSIIPFRRDLPKERWLASQTYYKHIGMYAYRMEVLERIASLPQSPLELSESLEQLRWLENGIQIQTAVTQVETLAVDTPDDLRAIESMLVR